MTETYRPPPRCTTSASPPGTRSCGIRTPTERLCAANASFEHPLHCIVRRLNGVAREPRAGSPTGLPRLSDSLPAAPRRGWRRRCSRPGASMRRSATRFPGAIDERIDSEMAKFVAAGRHEDNVASRLGLAEVSDQLEPTGNATAALARAPVPAARGVMITSGGSERSLPATVVVTLKAVAGVRLTSANTVASAPRRACSWSHPACSSDSCNVGGPNGCRKESALLGHRPGRLPRVTQTIALCRFCFRAAPSAPVPAAFGTEIRDTDWRVAVQRAEPASARPVDR